jgi:hypothetical protein
MHGARGTGWPFRRAEEAGLVVHAARRQPNPRRQAAKSTRRARERRKRPQWSSDARIPRRWVRRPMPKSVFTEAYRAVIASLRTARPEADVSQEELAQSLGKPQQFVSRVEQGISTRGCGRVLRDRKVAWQRSAGRALSTGAKLPRRPFDLMRYKALSRSLEADHAGR